MLSKLCIKNLAIIQELEIEFDRRFNVFTGQTGAGKSLIIGALGLLLGFRQGSSATVRPGADEARISGVFDLQGSPILRELAGIADLPVEDGELILRRRITAAGKSAADVNAVPITTQTLRRIGELLVDVHGQHENQSLLRSGVQLLLLDEFAGTTPLAEEFADRHRRWSDAFRRKRELVEHAELRNQQIELFEFQLQEIDQAALHPREHDEVEAEHRRLSHVEKIRELAGALVAGLEEGDFPVLDQLRTLYARADQLADLDKRLADLPMQINSALVELDDVVKTLSDHVDHLESDPQRLGELDERLALMLRLAKKYGRGDVENVLSYRDEIAQKLEDLRARQSDYESIDRQIDVLARERQDVGRKLSDARKKAAAKLAAAVNKQLDELAMSEAKFEVDLTPAGPDEPSPNGLETVEFLIRTNPGQPMLALRKIASAGELSRVMLAIKSILAAPGRSSVLVFDEVDSNVGGRLGEVIGLKIANLAARQQVICISHLPQIASLADRHFVVAKQSSKKETVSSVRAVTGNDRLAEIAEMISGKNTTATTLRQAEEMLAASRKILKTR